MTNNIHFTDNETFITRIETVLKIENKTRKELCEYVGVSAQAFTNWKQQSSLPSVETAIKISNFLQVNLEWLINGYITPQWKSDSGPTQVYCRIANILRTLPENKNLPSDCSSSELNKCLEGVVDNINTKLLNWEAGRSLPDPYDVYMIAKKIGQPYRFIATGIVGVDDGVEINGKIISNEDYTKLYQYTRWEKTLSKLENLPKESQETIFNLIEQLNKH